MRQTSITTLVECNQQTLDAAVKLLFDLPSDLYRTIQSPVFQSSFGKHCRHLVDHYLVFFRGLENSIIDYDQRQRDSQLEVDKEQAISSFRDIQKKLKQLVIEEYDVHRPLKIVMCNDVALPAGEVTVSSIGRELQFLQGHSVHHFALMAAMAKLSGLKVNKDFGVAPSTLVHNKTIKASA